MTRSANGTFGPGNKFARGGVSRHVSSLRSAMADAVSVDDMRAISAKIVELAKLGNLDAAKLALQYSIGNSDRVHDAFAAEAREAALRVSHVDGAAVDESTG